MSKNRPVKDYNYIRSLITQEEGLRSILEDLLARNAPVTIDGVRVRSVDQCSKLFMVADKPQAGSNQFYMSKYDFNKNGDLDGISFDMITVR